MKTWRMEMVDLRGDAPKQSLDNNGYPLTVGMDGVAVSLQPPHVSNQRASLQVQKGMVAALWNGRMTFEGLQADVHGAGGEEGEDALLAVVCSPSGTVVLLGGYVPMENDVQKEVDDMLCSYWDDTDAFMKDGVLHDVRVHFTFLRGGA